jgi:hypothetical protein
MAARPTVRTRPHSPAAPALPLYRWVRPSPIYGAAHLSGSNGASWQHIRNSACRHPGAGHYAVFTRHAGTG